LTSSRQTLSFLQSRLQAVGTHPRGKFGQNFLIDLNLLELLFEAAEVGPDDVVLEIGTGVGSLTNKLAAAAGWVVTVEIDPILARLAQAELSGAENITFMNCDALKNKNHFRPEVLQQLRDRLSERPGSRLKLVANLPYNVATPILSNLLDFQPLPAMLVATIQLELAERIVAAPSTKDYSALSVWIQSQAEAEIVRTMPPEAFWPRPKVHSAIIRIVPQPERRAALGETSSFHQLLRGIFLHRRKLLRSGLAAAVSPQLKKSDVDVILQQLRLPPDSRAEQLSIPQFVELIHRTLEALKQRSSSG